MSHDHEKSIHHDPRSRGIEPLVFEEKPAVFEPTPPGDNPDPILWVARGALVGLALGASAGSVIPIVGTLIGGMGGTFAGLGIGLATAVFAAATRSRCPAEAVTVEMRERIACLLFIWSPLLIARGAWAVLVAVAALLGSLHAVAAGTPVADAVYAGKVSERRRKFCVRLPFVIVGLIAVGWAVAALN